MSSTTTRRRSGTHRPRAVRRPGGAGGPRSARGADGDAAPVSRSLRARIAKRRRRLEHDADAADRARARAARAAPPLPRRAGPRARSTCLEAGSRARHAGPRPLPAQVGQRPARVQGPDAGVLPEPYRKRVIRANGDVAQTFLVDGLVAGTWLAQDGRVGTRFPRLSSRSGRVERSAEALLEPPRITARHSYSETLAEDRRAERVRLDDDPLALRLERAVRDEQRRADPCAPLLDVLEARAGSPRALSVIALDRSEVGGDASPPRAGARAASARRSRSRSNAARLGRRAVRAPIPASATCSRAVASLAAGALDLVRPRPSSALEVGEAATRRLELRSGARVSRLEGVPARGEAARAPPGSAWRPFAHVRSAAPERRPPARRARGCRRARARPRRRAVRARRRGEGAPRGRRPRPEVLPVGRPVDRRVGGDALLVRAVRGHHVELEVGATVAAAREHDLLGVARPGRVVVGPATWSAA